MSLKALLLLVIRLIRVVAYARDICAGDLTRGALARVRVWRFARIVSIRKACARIGARNRPVSPVSIIGGMQRIAESKKVISRPLGGLLIRCAHRTN